jgi:corrinoid protein of di/trimethylamine methyltransferase
MDKQNILQNLANAVIEMNNENVLKTTKDAIANGIDPLEIIENGLSVGMKIVGDKFNKQEFYLPELIKAANTFNASMKVLEPEIKKSGKQREKKGTVVLGTVNQDIHKIGKNIVSMLMQVRGYEVYDLGENVFMSDFLNKAEEIDADIIAMSSLLTTTMPAQKEVIDLLVEKGVREEYIVMVGGGPVNEQWAQEIGADGYAETAEEAVAVADKLISMKKVV